MGKILAYVKFVLNRNHLLSKNKTTSNFTGKVALQFIVAFSFLILSVANIFTKAYVMLIFTMSGFVFNVLAGLVALKTKNKNFCIYPSTIFCAVLFSIFVVGGGNDGFASLWIALFPIFAMVIMDLLVGLITSLILQGFLIVVLWTPINDLILYHYNEQFCIRFPLLFFVSLMLGLIMTLSLQKSQYEAQKHLTNLEKITEIATRLSKYDSLTGLVNRRCAYETFNNEFGDETIPHTIVMGDIDKFKNINDTYGHKVGDEVISIVAKYIQDVLPDNYIKSRWGGEEFLIAANESLDSVYEKIENLRLKISEHQFTFEDKHVNVTITFGIAEYYQSKDLDEAIKIADDRLYVGKKTTRNCTIKG